MLYYGLDTDYRKDGSHSGCTAKTIKVTGNDTRFAINHHKLQDVVTIALCETAATPPYVDQLQKLRGFGQTGKCSNFIILIQYLFISPSS